MMKSYYPIFGWSRWITLAFALFALSSFSYAGSISSPTNVDVCEDITLTYSGMSCSSINWIINFPDGSQQTASNVTSVAINVGEVEGQITISLTAFDCVNFLGGEYNDVESRAITVTKPRLAKSTSMLGLEYHCTGGSSLYQCSTVQEATGYQWNVPEGWKINGVVRSWYTSSSPSVTITVPSTNSGGGLVRVRAVKDDCTYPSYFLDKYVLYGDQMVQIDGPDSVKETAVARYYAIGEDLTNYSWTIPTGWSIYAGGSGDWIDVITDSNDGLISVTATAACNGTNSYDSHSVIIHPDGEGVELKADGPSDIPLEFAAAAQVLVYPNPAEHETTIRLSDKRAITQLRVYDMLQRVVYEAEPGTNYHRINLQHFENGMYTVVLTDGHHQVAQRLIIQH